MKEKYISRISMIVNSFLFFLAGIVLLLIPTTSAMFFHIIVSLLISTLGILSFVFNSFRPKKKINILLSISTFAMGMFFFSRPTTFLSLFPIIFGFYMLLNGIIKLLAYIIYKETKLKGYHPTLLASLIDFVFSYIMISNPNDNIKTLTIILGIYLIFFGVTYLYDLMKDLFPKLFKSKRRNIRVTLPIIISALIPYRIYTKTNTLLDKYCTPVHIRNKNTSGKVDLEIFIHVKDSLIGSIGHTDLCFENKVYSYACYDDNSKRLFETVADGMLCIIKSKSKYLKFCTNYSKKTIFSFGITLSEKQKNRIRLELNKMQEYAYRWKCDQEVKKEHCEDFASVLYRNTGVEYYKFTKGKWKTYFVFTTNCVKLVDKVLGATGSDILNVNGIVTPGAYYNFLNKEFKRKNSAVIKKTIYTKNKN